MRRVAVASLGLVLVTGLALIAGAVQPQAQAQEERSPFTGGWIVTFPGQPAGSPPALWTLTAEGNLLQTGARGVSTGVWEANGEDAAAFTLVFVAPAANNPQSFGGIETTRGTLQLSGEDAFTGSYTTTTTDPSGKVTGTTSGTLRATRITVGPSGTPGAGTPPVATPST